METLLGPLFESIEDPQQWQEFLVHFARAMNAPTAVSFINFRHPVAGNVAKTTGGAGIDQAFVAQFETHYGKLNPYLDSVTGVLQSGLQVVG